MADNIDQSNLERLMIAEKIHIFVINPRAFIKNGEIEAIYAQIQNTANALGISYIYIAISQYPRHATGIVSQIMRGHPKDTPVRVYAVGGDGLLFDCVNSLEAFANTEIAALPYGKNNDFVNHFTADYKLWRDIASAMRAPSVPIDIICCNGNYCVNFICAGIEALVKRNADEMLNRHNWLFSRNPKLTSRIYSFSTIFALFLSGYKGQYYDIKIDGKDYSGYYMTINMSNASKYGGNKSPVRMADPSDGWLDIVMIKYIKRRSIAKYGVLKVYFSGEHGSMPEYFTHVRGKEINITSQEDIIVDMDGEVFCESRLDVRLLESAILFATPEGKGIS